jgi:hypothetical protein
MVTAWGHHVGPSADEFDRLLAALGDLGSESLSSDALASVLQGGLTDALRYLAGPPISSDDLRVLAQVESLHPRDGALRRETAIRIRDVLLRVIDPHRFPWVEKRRAPTPDERRAAVLASSVLLASQRVATERRMEGKDAQEASVKRFLRTLGFEEVPPASVETIVKGPQRSEFSGECKLGARKVDVLVRLHDTRLLAIECKVSNSSTNSIKRLNNDAAVKASYWIEQFGSSQVVPCAVLSGVFKPLNLEQAQERGLWLVWAHDLGRLGSFIEATRKPLR